MEHSPTHREQRAREVRRAPARSPQAPDVAALLSLQRSAGNAAVNRLLRAPAPSVTHLVAEGERIDQIAARYDVTVDELAAANQDKLRRWGDVTGFNAGDEIVIPQPEPAPTPEPTPLQDEGSWVEWAIETWNAWFGDRGTAPPEDERRDVPEPQPKRPRFKDPIEVIAHHNAAGTFSQHVTVTSSKRDNERQLKILRDFCNANREAVDAYAAETDWLAGTLDWDAFQSAGLGDESVYLPFFFALYYGGGGPGVSTKNRSLPLVASPVQSTWTDANGRSRTANASPHIAGRAMDADAADLETLNLELKEKVPEFAADGLFPVSSTQVETVKGQTAVHVTFVNPVF